MAATNPFQMSVATSFGTGPMQSGSSSMLNLSSSSVTSGDVSAKDTYVIDEKEKILIEKTKNFIVLALQDRARGYRGGYNTVIQQLRTDDVATRVRFYFALCSCAAAINADCHELVAASLDLDIARAPISVLEPFRKYLANLLSSNSCFAKACCILFVRLFLPIEKPQPVMVSPIGQEKVIRYDEPLSLQASERGHAFLRMVCASVPSTPLVLWPCIQENFPHLSLPLYTIKMYTRNLLLLLQYCSVLRDRIHVLLVENLLRLDVEINVDKIDDDDDEEEDDDDGMNRKTGGDEHTLQFSFEGTGEEGSASMSGLKKMENTMVQTPLGAAAGAGIVVSMMGEKESEAQRIAELADKLDSLMLLYFTYFKEECLRSEANCDELFRLFLRIFDSLVLNTHRCKFVQFILFFVSKFKMDFPDLFLGYLLNKLLDPTLSATSRKLCASYVASYVSRAAFIRMETLRNTIAVLVGWIHKYLDEHELKPPNLVVHSLFYHVCQGIYYIFCFRHADLALHHDGIEFFKQLGFERINNAKLKPLQFCLRSVAKEFARITEGYQLLQCKHLINSSGMSFSIYTGKHEKGKGSGLKDSVSLMDHNNEQLSSFFPFDPYLLHDSAPFIEPIYVTWDGRSILSGDSRDAKSQRNNTSDSLGKLMVARGSFGEGSYGSAESYGTSPASQYLAGLARSLSRSMEEGDTMKLMSTTPDVVYDLNFEF